MPYQLTPKDAKYLTLEIEGKQYNIPLANSLKIKKIRAVMKITKLPDEDQIEPMVEFFAEYIPQEILDEMLMDDLLEIIHMWKQACEAVSGLTVGE